MRLDHRLRNNCSHDEQPSVERMDNYQLELSMTFVVAAVAAAAAAELLSVDYLSQSHLHLCWKKRAHRICIEC